VFYCIQQLRCPPSARDESPVRTWAVEIVRAGCGRRRMLRAISHRNGRSTGLF